MTTDMLVPARRRTRVVGFNPAIDRIHDEGQRAILEVLAGGHVNLVRARGLFAADPAHLLTIFGEADRGILTPDLLAGVTLDEPIWVPGAVRRNDVLVTPAGELLTYGQGSLEVSADQVLDLLEVLADAEGDSWTVFSGSWPEQITPRHVRKVIRILRRLGVNVLLDSRPEIVEEVLQSQYRPTIIKVNRKEAEQAFGVTLDPEHTAYEDLNQQMIGIAQRHLPDGVLAITLGSFGPFVHYQKHAWRATVTLPQGWKHRWAHGCGDTFTGALIGTLEAQPHLSLLEALPGAIVNGAIAGAAATRTRLPGAITPELLAELDGCGILEQVA